MTAGAGPGAAATRGTLVQDCEVCCNPWTVRVSGRGDDRVVQVSRTDE